jgi:hypothetical protein
MDFSPVILYRLSCACGHEFDSWFRNSATYDRQAAKGALTCAACGSNTVTKAMMAPRIGGRASREDPAPAVEAPAPSVPMALSEGPDLPTMLRALRHKIETECDYVGPRFAEEARAIAEDKAEARAIYGEATAEEAASLIDDGIDVAQIPWLPRHDA